jgi:hypothetical protein
METVLTTVLAAALGALLLLVFVAMPLAVLGLCGLSALRLVGASADFLRSLRGYWHALQAASPR